QVIVAGDNQAGFLDTISLEQDYLDSGDFEEDKDYWLNHFKTAPEMVELVPRTTTEDLEHEMFRLQLDDDRNRRIFSFCRDKDQSPFRVFLAVLYTCLARRSGKTDISIGSASFNRANGRVPDSVTGMFVSTIPFRLQGELERSFSDLLGDVRTSVKEALTHQRYPYDLLIKELRESQGDAPDLMPVSLVQFVRPELPEGYRFDFVPPSQSLSKLTVYLSYDVTGDEKASPITFYCSYASSVFDRSEVDLLLNHVVNLLMDGISTPAQPLSKLRMISDREQNQIVNGFNSSTDRHPAGQPIHVWVEQQVRRSPDKTAVVYRDRKISYREMNSRANQLARKLRSMGVVRDSVVGLWGERCLELIIGQLAILKAGGAFMPIDEKYPLDRVEFMLEDSGAPVLLAQQHLVAKVDFATRVLALDSPTLFEGDEDDLDPIATEDDMAVLIYTSGSTGKPKGVMIEHKSMSNFIFTNIDDLKLTEADGVAKHASFSFDASNLEIYPCLCSGATLHIIGEELRLSLSALNEYYESNKITFGLFTTQLGEQFMDLLDNRSLRTLIVGGEKLRSYKKRNYQLVNGYGPTECTVMSSSYPVTELEDNIPIGRPATNYKTLVLDRFGNLQPVGVPGELCICGVSVARGYLNRPEKTAEAFGVSPLDCDERMYRTNDLAYWRPDGNLVYLGRMDRQVKLRGYRVELGEIEQAMLALDNISEAAVVDLKDEGGRLYLCGYFVAGERLAVEDLAAAIGESLPQFMVPSHLVQLDRLPVTPNGKIDRKQLPEPTLEEPHQEMFVEPETEAELHLARIWGTLLKHEKIGRNDNFFNIGGDSLKTVSLQVTIEQELEVSPSVTDLFKAATLKEQGRLIESLGQKRRAEITAAPEAEFYPATVSQKQLYILSCFKDASTTYNMPFQIELRGAVDPKRLADALHDLVERFAVLRTSFEVADGQPMQRVHDEVYVKMEYGEGSADDIDSLGAEFIRPFRLDRPPLFRVKLVRLAVDHHVLLIDIHHIISDGVSVGLFMGHLSDCYNGVHEEAPQVQFKDYGVWNKENSSEEKLGESGRFWEETFDQPPEVELPTDHPRPPQADFKGGLFEFVLDPELTGHLKAAGREQGATLHHVLLAVLAVLVGNYTEKDDLVLGTTTAGRFVPGTEEMMGMFVNTLPVRVRPAGDKAFSGLLAEVRDMMLQVLDHEAYPIDLLYEKLGINRGPGQNPLFDVNFVLRNMEQRELELDGGVEARLKLFNSATAKFDLSFAAEEMEIKDSDGTQLFFHLEYRSSLFEHDTVQRMANHFLRIAAMVAANPDLCLGDIEMLHPDEKNFLRYTINDTVTTPPAWPSVSRAFEKNAARFPDAVALVAEGARLSYRELNERANRFASLLLQRSMARDTIIGVVADRSAEAVVGMMGALKAGAAYVGIDPGYPEERISFILEDTKTPLIAGSSRGVEEFQFAGEKIRLDDLPGELSAENPSQTIDQDNLAYIIFTSGSTGTPKGVMIEHRAMVNFIDWYIRFNGISEDENCAEFAAFSFDVSVVQVFAPLTAGASLHIIPEETRRDPFTLNEYFTANMITHAHLPTRFAEQFMRVVDNQSLKRIVVGGDRLTSYRIGNFRLINEYGPSETCMASTALSVTKQYERVPVGAPIANTRVYVLGRNNQLRPIGLPGELCIGGTGVARGYLNRADLTAEKFIEDPFDPQGRMYRTGDMARILPDGNIDFIGRRDFQVKIRGYRIEPGEIEERLNRHPDIENSVVTPIENQEGGDKSLCAYYEAHKRVEKDDLKKILVSELPDYMVPSFFMQMDELPLNRNGKIDRQRLP
ncbi:MAG: amino acid adenylation domain-containing protein, partial [Thermodesulfobacteriota bacterium]